MTTMGANDKTAADESTAPDGPARSREELLRRIDEIWDRRHELEVEPSPGIKELVDSQDEFRARIEERLRRISGR